MGPKSEEARVQNGGWLLSPKHSVGTWNGSSHLAPPPQRCRHMTVVPISYIRRSRPRKVGELAESLSLASQEPTLSCLS